MGGKAFDCVPRLSLLNPPMASIFGGLFTIFSLIGFVMNTLVLKILLTPSNRTRTNKILLSRVVTDLITAVVLGPLFSWQLLDKSASQDCRIDLVRRYCLFVIQSTSYLTLAVIVHDRCILLTRLNYYESYMSRRKYIILIVLVWLFPVIAPYLVYVNYVLYFCAAGLVFIVSVSSLFVSYCRIKKAMKEHNKTMQKHKKEWMLYENTLNNRYKEQHRRELLHFRMAKMVYLLIICYFGCVITSNVWFILHAIGKFKSIVTPRSSQLLYVCAFTIFQINSCLNPFLYFHKNPQFKRTLRNMFKPWNFNNDCHKEHWEYPDGNSSTNFSTIDLINIIKIFRNVWI